MSDIKVREMQFGEDALCVIYISNYSSKDMISRQIIKPVSEAYLRGEKHVDVKDVITSAAVAETATKQDALKKLLSGAAIVLHTSDVSFGLSVMTKNEEGRSISEPETENVIRGPHEGFTESAEVNVMMLRRRLKTEKLKKEDFTVGEKSGTDVFLMYIDGVANEKLIAEARRRIGLIKTDGVTDSGTVEIYIQDGRRSIYPTVGNSERPDKVAAKLLEGRVAVIVDGSPVVLTAPYLFCEAFQVTEDYAKSPWYASFIRLMRLFAFLIAIYLPALFVALEEFHRNMLSPEILSAIDSARENLPFSVFWEVMVIFLIFETVREVGLRMPKAVGAAVGLVGSLILGDSAIEAGVASAPVLIVVALAAVCNFIVPPYMHPNILYRFSLIIMSGTLGLFGFFLGTFIGLAVMCGKDSFGVPYFVPFAPIYPKGLKDFPIMTPIWSMTEAPSAITGKKIVRAKEKEKNI